MRSYWILCLTMAFVAECRSDERIFGGTDAAPGQIPYIVSVRRADGSHFCGGSIIDNRWILTATLCTGYYAGFVPSYVVAGTTSLAAGAGVQYKILKIILHEEMVPGPIISKENDIALMKTEIPIVFNANVQPIPLGIFPLADDSAITTAGWGVLTNPGTASPTLKVLDTKTISYAACKTAYNISQVSYKILPSMICEVAVFGKGFCAYDQGGPHVANGQLHGISSWFDTCGSSTLPSVTTRVSSYIPWIIKTKLFNMF